MKNFILIFPLLQNIYFVLMVLQETYALNDGLARTPPMGWRTWNAFELDVDQNSFLKTAHIMRMKKKFSSSWSLSSSDGGESESSKSISLADAGYIDVGLDDGWQYCLKSDNPKLFKNSFSFHDNSGNPYVNKTRFPNMKNMVNEIHSLNLTAGFYLNNCWCQEEKNQNKEDTEKQMIGDAKLAMDSGFDGVKLDGCGPAKNLTHWRQLFLKAQIDGEYNP